MRYRPEIDGLRALAVLPVILFHGDFVWFSGGYIGVDVFFVISGYLITLIILSDLEKGQFSICEFYERRARRILPALFFVMLCSIPFAWVWLTPQQFDELSKSLIAITFFVSNIYFWRNLNYFSPAAEENPFLHTWSLAVEEQFYIIFPVMLLLVWRFGRNQAFLAVAVLSLGSLALAEWGARTNPTANFYLLPTRAWELGAGSLCAFLLSRKSAPGSEFLAAAGLGLILFSVFYFDETTPFPSLYALAPVGGTVLVIVFAHPSTWVARTLSMRPLVGIGLISYSAYLWHQPLFAFARMRSLTYPAPELMAALAVMALLLAYLSWRYVEQPFRRRPVPALPTRVRVFATSVIFATMFATLGVYGHASDGRVNIWKKTHSELVHTYRLVEDARRLQGRRMDDGDCRFDAARLDRATVKRLTDCHSRYGPGLAIIGDSHAIDLFLGLYLEHDGPFIFGMTAGGCHPYSTGQRCQYAAFARFVKNSPLIFDQILYTQAGHELLETPTGASGREIFSHVPEYDLDPSEYMVRAEDVEAVATYLDSLAAGPRVTWLGSRLEPQIRMRFVMRRGCLFPYKLRSGLSEIFRHLEEKVTGAVADGEVRYVSQMDLVDFDINRDFLDCNVLYWRDGDHWSRPGARKFVGRMLARGLLAADTAGR